MAIAYTLATNVLLLNGGTSGTNLTPSNIISDATTYSAATTYALGTIVKQDNSDGIGVSLWRCSTAITVAEAWTYSKWTRIAWIANKTIRLAAILDIGAYYNDTGWNYETTTMIRTATGVKWTSGSVDSTSQMIGFKMNHSGSYTDSGWNLFNGGGSTDFVNWTRCEIFKASTNRADISMTNSNLPVTIRNLTIDGRSNAGDNHNISLSSASDVDGINLYYCNLGIAPINNLKNVGHLGLFNESPQNKIGILTSGGILKSYSPSLPTNLSRLVGLISGSANQYLQDIVVPAGFLLSTVQAYYVTTSAYFTRTVEFTFKQGATLLGNVYVYGYKTGSQITQTYIGTSNATTGIYNAVAQVFYGNRAATAGGSYVALQNTIDWTNQTVLFRRIDLVEASYQQDMNVNGISLTQFMVIDTYNTIAVPATVAAYPITISGTTITATAAAPLSGLYDYVKYWLTQNMAIANFMSASGTTIDIGSQNVVGLQYYTKSTNITNIKTTGSVTAIGEFSVNVDGNVFQAIPTNLTGVKITGTLTYNTNVNTTITITDTNIDTVENLGTGIITINKVNSTIQNYTDAEINFIDSTISVIGADTITFHPTATDRDLNQNTSGTFTSSYAFKYGSTINGTTMSGTLYLRCVAGGIPFNINKSIVLGDNLVDLGTTAQLASLSAKIDLTAKEATLLQTETDIISEVNANEVKIDTAITKIDTKPTLTQIEGSTILSKEATLLQTETDIISEINANEVKIDAVKAKTDRMDFNAQNHISANVHQLQVGAITSIQNGLSLEATSQTINTKVQTLSNYNDATAQGKLDDIKSKTDTLVNTDISTLSKKVDTDLLLKYADYVAPDNTKIAQIKTKVDILENYDDTVLENKVDDIKTKVLTLENTNLTGIESDLVIINDGVKKASKFKPHNTNL